MGSVFCTQCGQSNPDDARFCANCGTALVRVRQAADTEPTTTALAVEEIEALETGHGGPRLAEQAAEAVQSLAPGTALLVVNYGPNAGSRFLLDSDLTTAGRHPNSDIFLDDVTVSRRHAEFHRRGRTFAVRDLGSLNGTYVNRERIEEQVLASGDTVRIGKFGLVFLAAP